MSELVALANGVVMGVVHQGRDGRVTFTYDDTWRTAQDGYPLSLSMPLVVREHLGTVIQPFLAGLLPDSDRILEQWGRRFGVSPRNPVALLRHVGEDCAGAVQFVVPERVAIVQGDGTKRRTVAWLTEHQVAERLRALGRDVGAWQAPSSQGQFSLAGAQPKIALYLDQDRWGVPHGRTPTTHILKPPTGTFDGFPENEHFCLQLAQKIGLPAAESWIGWFDDQIALIVTRYDRHVVRNRMVRIHQEDFCQALAIPPARKYQSDGGPGTADIADVLWEYSSASASDLQTFVRSLAFHWVIGAPDAHAKNYSVLLGRRDQVRLAPLYDIISTLPYEHLDHKQLRLAMQIGGEARMERIGLRQWRTLAALVHMDEAQVLQYVREVIGQVAAMAGVVRRDIAHSGVKHPILARLEALMTERAERCRMLVHR